MADADAPAILRSEYLFVEVLAVGGVALKGVQRHLLVIAGLCKDDGAVFQQKQGCVVEHVFGPGIVVGKNVLDTGGHLMQGMVVPVTCTGAAHISQGVEVAAVLEKIAFADAVANEEDIFGEAHLSQAMLAHDGAMLPDGQDMGLVVVGGGKVLVLVDDNLFVGGGVGSAQVFVVGEGKAIRGRITAEQQASA